MAAEPSRDKTIRIVSAFGPSATLSGEGEEAILEILNRNQKILCDIVN